MKIKEFAQNESDCAFTAYSKATKYCALMGYSVASMCSPEPTAIMKGDWYIAKWRNLTHKERTAAHGTITGRFREGPVVVRMFNEAQE